MRLLALIGFVISLSPSAHAAETGLRSMHPGQRMSLLPRLISGLGYTLSYQDGGLMGGPWDYRSPICNLLNSTAASMPSLTNEPVVFEVVGLSGGYVNAVDGALRAPAFQSELYLRSAAGMVLITCRSPAASGEWQEITPLELERAFGSALKVEANLTNQAQPILAPRELQTFAITVLQPLKLSAVGFGNFAFESAIQTPVRCGLRLQKSEGLDPLFVPAGFRTRIEGVRLDYSAEDNPLTGESAGWYLEMELAGWPGFAKLSLTCASTSTRQGLSKEEFLKLTNSWLQISN